MNESESQWERAFHLAFFIIPDRTSALEVLKSAIEKLGSQRSRERRRTYWRGRNRKLRIRRISRPGGDTLQWLIYLESGAYEKKQEESQEPTKVDLVIRYAKHLVQLTTGASSFYVNIGLNRLLRNYSTPEVQQIYEFTTEHYPASEEYRKVKARLMNALTARFDRFLRIQTSEYRELRFETCQNQAQWLGVVEECLEFFTPWSSRRACLEGLADLRVGEPGTGVWHPDLPSHPDGVETNRCHWFMHTPCYGELAKKLGFDAPQKRLSVPQFSLRGNDGPNGNANISGRTTDRLSEDERNALKDHLDSSETKRKQASTRLLKIVTHGVVRAHLNPYQDDRLQFDIPDGTKLIEIQSEVNGSNLTLATHWIDYTECEGIASGEYTISLRDKRELILKVVPSSYEGKEEGGAVVVVAARSASFLSPWLQRIAYFFEARRKLWGYAVAAVVLVGLGWFAATMRDQAQLARQRVSQPLASGRATMAQQPSREATRPVPTYLLAAGVPTLRGPGGAKEAAVVFAPNGPLVMLELLIPRPFSDSYRASLSSFVDDQELLSENPLTRKRTDSGWVVEFAVPSSCVTNDTHYLVTLASLDRSGHATPVARYVFQVRK